MNLSSNPRVLLVDDDDLIRDLYQRVFDRLFDIQTARSSVEALRLIQTEEPFAVVMSDLQMPGMNGIELLRQVRTLSPDTSRILLTGLLNLPELESDANLTTVIAKPCEYPQLLEALRCQVEAYEIRCGRGEHHDS